MAPFDFLEGEGKAYDMDGWDGFTATRQRILDHIAKAGISNPVALGGNIHSYYAGVVNRIAADPESEALLSEIVATSISSQGARKIAIFLRTPSLQKTRSRDISTTESAVMFFAMCKRIDG